MKKIIFFAFVALILSITTPTAEAYHTTAQNAFTVNGRTGVYTITFVLGHQKHDVYVPVSAFSDNTANDSTHLSYALKDTNGNSSTGSNVGIVLSSLKIQNGMYRISKGTGATFTLLVLYTPQNAEMNTSRALQVTNLPFNFDKAEQLKLNPSELEYYVTPSLFLGEKVSITVSNPTILYTSTPRK